MTIDQLIELQGKRVKGYHAAEAEVVGRVDVTSLVKETHRAIVSQEVDRLGALISLKREIEGRDQMYQRAMRPADGTVGQTTAANPDSEPDQAD